MTETTSANDQQPHNDHLANYHNFENSEVSQLSQSGSNMGRSLGQILIIMVVLLVLVNIPFNSYSAGLAQLIPQNTSIVIRDGTLLKGSVPEVYVMDNYKLRLISPEALEVFFSHNRRINTVEDDLLTQFGRGPTIYRLLQCRTNPDVFALEDGHKRRVTEPPTNAVQSWDKASLVSCSYLEGLPDGLPIHTLAGR